MTLGSELKKFIPVGKTQKTIALELAEALKDEVGIQYSPDTAESRWSEALKGKLTGLRFFFESEQRMETTLGALSVPSSDKARIRQLIRAAMGGQTVLLDLTTAEQLTPAVYGGLRTWLLSVESEVQVIVGLSDAQYDNATASFRECGARFERGDLTKLRETAAFIVSEEPVQPIERWLAVSFTATPIFSPANWRERLLDGADLGGLPRPMRPARLIAKPEKTRTSSLPRGPGLRELMLALATGAENPTLDRFGRSLSDRLALGQILGIEVEASEKEWDSARFEGMTRVESGVLQSMLLRSRLTGASLTLLVGDKIHLVNPTDITKQRMQSPLYSSEEVAVHDERLDPERYLQQLREDASWLTQEQVFADPWLDAWLEKRYRDDWERLVARDGLAWLAARNQLAFGASESVVDWRPSLRALISAVPARATLLSATDGGDFYVTRTRAYLRGDYPSHLRPFAPLLVSREDDDLLWKGGGANVRESGAGWGIQLQERLMRVTKDSSQQRKIEVLPGFWAQADELLARVLDSLAFTASRGPARLTRDGWAHLLLGVLPARMRESELT